MAESIKLNGNKYIDAEGVWDSNHEKTQSQLNEMQTASIASGITCRKIGNVVNCSLVATPVLTYNDTIVIPEGYRPLYDVTFIATGYRGEGDTYITQIDIIPSGKINFHAQITEHSRTNFTTPHPIYGNVSWFTA